MGLENVNHVLLVLSGKGGVGKSSVTIQLALSLTQQGYNVGILDIDLTGPSIPRFLNMETAKIRQAPGGWLPVQVHNARSDANGVAGSEQVANGSSHKRGSLHALSLAFLLPSRDSAVIWRGPKKTAMIRQFVSDVLWPPNTDYLLIDTPPGTSDEHIAIVEELHKLGAASSSIPAGMTKENNVTLAGAVIVTTPQAISTADVRKELNFCVKTQVRVLGVIENMAGYMCPCCGDISNVFSKGGGEIMARECNVPFLGSVPIETQFGELVEGVRRGDNENMELVEKYKECRLYPIFSNFAQTVTNVVDNTPS